MQPTCTRHQTISIAQQAENATQRATDQQRTTHSTRQQASEGNHRNKHRTTARKQQPTNSAPQARYCTRRTPDIVQHTTNNGRHTSKIKPTARNNKQPASKL
eukprot:8042536-Alexandrium_andersonii.AAC.1